RSRPGWPEAPGFAVSAPWGDEVDSPFGSRGAPLRGLPAPGLRRFLDESATLTPHDSRVRPGKRKPGRRAPALPRSTTLDAPADVPCSPSWGNRRGRSGPRSGLLLALLPLAAIGQERRRLAEHGLGRDRATDHVQAA